MDKIKFIICSLASICQFHSFAQQKSVEYPSPLCEGKVSQVPLEICYNCAENYFYGGQETLSKHIKITFTQQKTKIPLQGNIEINFELDSFGKATNFRIAHYDILPDTIAWLTLSSISKIDRWKPPCTYDYGNSKIVCKSQTMKLCLFFKDEKVRFLFDRRTSND
jgi:hypothetical protein